MDILKEINKDMDDVTYNVDKIYAKHASPYKAKVDRSMSRSVERNYHPPLSQEE